MSTHKLVQLFILTMTILVLFVCIDWWLKPGLVTLDKSQLLTQFIGQLSQHTLSDKALALKTEQFSLVLQRTLQDYARRHRVLILDKSAVLAGQRDITPEITQRIAVTMRGGA